MANTNLSCTTLNQTPQVTDLTSCTPQNIFIDFDQTLFLGCSVLSFTCSVGWNSQQSQLAVELVEDTCAAEEYKPKFYWDSQLQKRSTTAPDPGFLGLTENIIGCPVYFRVADFEFSGIVQSWEEIKNNGQFPSYRVNIIDPRLILDGAYLLVGDYSGQVTNFNLFNVYGFSEQFGALSPLTSQNPQYIYQPGDSGPDGAIFGSEAGGYGGSLSNANGMPWYRILQCFNVLANQIPRNSSAFSPYGRILYKGTYGGNYGLMNADFNGFSEYFLDLSELPNVPDFYRISSTEISLSDAIGQICEDAGYDYYIELVPVKTSVLAAASGIAKFIKVRTVSRNSNPVFGAISDFVSNNKVISSQSGRELRNELMSSLIIGGNKKSLYQVGQSADPEGDGADKISQGGASQTGADEIDDMIIPYFGVDENENLIVPEKDADGKWKVAINTTELNNSLEFFDVGNSCVITQDELSMSLGGYDTLFSYWNALAITNAFVPGSLSEKMHNQLEAAGLGGLLGLFMIDVVLLGKADKLKAVIDFFNLRAGVIEGFANNAGNIIENDKDKILEFFTRIARKFGGEFAVRVPYTSARIDDESGSLITSETPTNEGWTEYSTVLGLPEPQLSLFRNEDGLINALARFNLNELDVSIFNQEEDAIVDDKMYRGIEVSDQFVFHNRANAFGPRVVVSFDPVIKKEFFGDGAAMFDLLGLLLDNPEAGIEKLREIQKQPGAQALAGFVRPIDVVFPDAVAFGLESNTLTYGPWTNLGLPGQIKISKDEGLTPWNYGNTSTMNQAAILLASEGVTNMQVGEMGSITVPGYPTLPLGSELGAFGGGFFGGGNHLVENRSISEDNFSEEDINGDNQSFNYGFFAYNGNWSGIYGPNITSINVSVGRDGVTTTYQLRTYTPKVGRFAKHNADRLSKISKRRIDTMRDRRGKVIQSARSAFKLARKRNLNGFFNREKAKAKDKGTPHFALVGKLIDSTGDYKRASVVTENPSDLAWSIANEYETKAFASLDTIVRPVSIDGYAGLPQFYKSSSTICHPTAPLSVAPPITGLLNTDISINYLNPFSNPDGLDNSHIQSRTQGDGNIGHDMEMVGRAGSIDTSGSNNVPYHLGMRKADETGIDSYTGDYGMLAMRGPILLQSWGYDVEGKPVPNSVDTTGNASQGIFTKNNLTDEFMEGFLQKSHCWPVAPIDLRLDRERGVWITPPNPYAKLVLTLIGDSSGCCNGEGGFVTGTLDTSAATKQYYDSAGNLVTSHTLTAKNIGNNIYKSGDVVLVDYQPDTCQYVIIDGPNCMVAQTGNSGCFSGDITGDKRFNVIYPGRNIHFKDDACGRLGINASIALHPTGDDDIEHIFGIKAGSGIQIERTGDCPHATISLEDSTGCSGVIGSILGPNEERIRGIVAGTGIILETSGDGPCHPYLKIGLDTSGTDGANCKIPGIDLTSIPVSTTPDYILGVEGSCLVLVATGECTGTG